MMTVAAFTMVMALVLGICPFAETQHASRFASEASNQSRSQPSTVLASLRE